MFKIILLLLLIPIIGFLVLGVFLGGFIRAFRPDNKNKSRGSQRNSKSQNSQTQNTPTQKVFKDEGEYIDYEEVKDE